MKNARGVADKIWEASASPRRLPGRADQFKWIREHAPLEKIDGADLACGERWWNAARAGKS
jgi:hypothetical protein